MSVHVAPVVPAAKRFNHQKVFRMNEHGSLRVTQVSESDAIAVAGGLYQPIRLTLAVRAVRSSRA